MDNNELSNFERNMVSLRGALHNLVSDAIQDSWDMFEQWDLPSRTADVIDNAKARMGLVFPQVDLKDTGKNIVLKADVPGVDPEALDIEIGEDHVYIAGVANYEDEAEDEGYYSYERHFGSFERTIPLPDFIDVDAAIGEVKDGILTITMPKLMIEAPAKEKSSPKKSSPKSTKKTPAKKKTTPKKATATKKKATPKKPAPKKTTKKK
ncbi:Hsp20/alpha crystallin family protein [Candidatus Nomurabacteria bacterium]|nr:Hsp20/alpha crystallin family protein [Candidatus Nomurabacteria bacterium]